MGVVLQEEGGDLRLTHYGWVRVVLPLLGLAGFAGWWLWTSSHDRQTYREFKAALPGLEQKLRQEIAAVDEAALRAGKHLEALKVGADDSVGPDWASTLRESLAARRFAVTERSLKDERMDLHSLEGFEPLRDALVALGTHRLNVLATVQEIRDRSFRLGSGVRKDAWGDLLSDLERCIQQVEFAFERQQNPMKSDDLDTSAWPFAREKLDEVLARMDALAKSPDL